MDSILILIRVIEKFNLDRKRGANVINWMIVRFLSRIGYSGDRIATCHVSTVLSVWWSWCAEDIMKGPHPFESHVPLGGVNGTALSSTA